MPKLPDLTKRGLYRLSDIITEAKKTFKIGNLSEYEVTAIKMKINRSIDVLNIKPTMVKIKQNEYKYIEHSDVYRIFDNNSEYFSGYSSEKNFVYEFQIQSCLDKQKEIDEYLSKREEEYKEVGLTKEEGQYLDVDTALYREYLSVEELKLLNKKGLILRNSSDLKAEDIELLKENEQIALQFEAEEKMVDELFYKKKLEIMITALFDKYFELDEKQLREDIYNYVHGVNGTIVKGMDDTDKQEEFNREASDIIKGQNHLINEIKSYYKAK